MILTVNNRVNSGGAAVMSKEEELLEYWQALTADQQATALNFLKDLRRASAEQPTSTLGQRLQAIRQRIVASGVPLLTWDDLETEVADRRGGEAARDR
jgi:hypothetical protein